MPGCSAAPPPGGDTQPLPRSSGAGSGKPGRRPEAAAAGGGGSALPGAVRALELAEARRRLLEVEARRRLVWELESRVQQLHRVFVQAELRMAGRAESLARLGSGAGQAQIHLAAHGQRLKKSLRRSRKARPPALLASALGGCVPWAAGPLRRGRGGAAAAPEPPESPFKRSLRGPPDAAPLAPGQSPARAGGAPRSWGVEGTLSQGRCPQSGAGAGHPGPGEGTLS